MNQKTLKTFITGEIETPGYWYNPDNILDTYYELSIKGKIVNVYRIRIITQYAKPRIWIDTREKLLYAKDIQSDNENWNIMEHGACAEIHEHFLMLLRQQIPDMEIR